MEVYSVFLVVQLFATYDYNDKTRIDRYLISNGNGFLRLTNTNFSSSLSLSGDRISSSNDDGRTTVQQDQYLQQSEQTIYQGIYTQKEADFSIPWDLSLITILKKSRPIPTSINKSSNVSGSVNFNLTPKWKFSVTGSYDLQRQEFAAPQVKYHVIFIAG